MRKILVILRTLKRRWHLSANQSDEKIDKQDGIKGCKPVIRVSRSSLICDPDTKEFCACGEPEPATSSMACVATVDNSFLKDGNTGSHNILIKKGKLKKKIQQKMISDLKKT